MTDPDGWCDGDPTVPHAAHHCPRFHHLRCRPLPTRVCMECARRRHYAPPGSGSVATGADWKSGSVILIHQLLGHSHRLRTLVALAFRRQEWPWFRLHPRAKLNISLEIRTCGAKHVEHF